MAEDWEVEDQTDDTGEDTGDEGSEDTGEGSEEVVESIPLISTVRKIHLMNGEEELIFPITPESYDITDNWTNEEISINQLGVITMIGNRGLRSLSFSSFFPAQEYDFLVPGSTTEDCNPWAMVKKLLDWRGNVLTLFIADTDNIISWPCVIDADFVYGERDASGDVYYTITLKEYKQTNSERKVKDGGDGEGNIKFPYYTKNGDTLNKISKQYCGTKEYAKLLYTQNKKAVKASFKRYKASLTSKAAKNSYKKLSKYKKWLDTGTKLILVLVKQRG